MTLDPRYFAEGPQRDGRFVVKEVHGELTNFPPGHPELTREFLHRGIAARQFQRSFLLAEGVEVQGASLRNGMLTIAVVRPKAEKIARRIKISSA